MSWKIFQRWFNCPPTTNSEYITDKSGEKFWISWGSYFDLGLFLYVSYRGKWVGTVESYWKENGGLELTDIVIFEQFSYLRHRNLGKKMIRYLIERAKKEGRRYIQGIIIAHDGSSNEYLNEWYQRQGFQVDGGSIYLALQDNQ